MPLSASRARSEAEAAENCFILQTGSVFINILFAKYFVFEYNNFMIKKLVIFTILACTIFIPDCKAADTQIYDNLKIQHYIDNVAFNILNANRIDKRMVFTYNEQDQKTISLSDKTITRRQIVVYKNKINHISDENELAAFLSREIVKGTLSYDGFARGFVTSAQMKCAPKKYELFFDKRAVDLMVKAGYNPVAMIVFLNKLGEQKRFSFFLTNNTVSKRMAEIYEYIYFKYPEYLANNIYLTNKYYQNFLLTSEKNRRMLQEKIMTSSQKRLKYE